MIEVQPQQWPVGVPKNNKELFEKGGEWEKFIIGRLRMLNKVGRNIQDIYQDVVLKLIASDILKKFVAKAATRLPAEMKASEMCAYVGITRKKLEFFHWRHRNPEKARAGQVPVWMPTPIRGGIYSANSIYARSDVIDFDRLLDQPNSGCRRNDGKFPAQRRRKMEPMVDEHGECLRDEQGDIILEHAKDESGEPMYFEVGGAVERQMVFAPTGDGFKTYLGNAIHNHFANFCRTKFRREKEHLLSPNSVISASGDGAYHVAATFEEVSSWEASLADTSLHEDELEAKLDFVAQFREACEEMGLDVSVIADYAANLDEEGKEKLREDATRGVELLDFMARTGQGLPEACAKVGGLTLSKDLTRRIRGLPPRRPC